MLRFPVLRIAFAAVAIAGIALVALALISLKSYQRSADQSLDAARVTVLGEALLIDLGTAESAQRGFFITQDEATVERYRKAVATLNARLDNLTTLVDSNEAQLATLANLRPMVAEKVAEMDLTIQLIRDGNRPAAGDIVRTGDGERLGDAILAEVTNLVRVEAEQLNSARSTADARGTQSIVAVSALAAVTAALLGWVFWALRRHHVEEGLRRANRDKDEFLGMVSHELRTPITVVLGNARLLRRSAAQLPAEELSHSLEDIEAHGERMQRIVENMLTLSRDRVSAESTEPVMIPRLINQAVERHRGRVSGSEVLVSIEPKLPLALANSAYVDQVLQNLLSNAAKYGSNTAPIEVSAGRREGRVAVSVSDRGPGIELDRRAMIFEPFVRLPGAEGSAEGLGLGLPVCRRLLEAQGGDISVAARDGGGSVFTFTLAAVEDVEEFEAEQNEPAFALSSRSRPDSSGAE